MHGGNSDLQQPTFGYYMFCRTLLIARDRISLSLKNNEGGRAAAAVVVVVFIILYISNNKNANNTV